MGYRLALSLTFATAMLTAGTAAQAAPITGTWVGNGIVHSKTGRKESVRCRISYGKDTGKTYEFSARCASTAGQTRSGRGRVVQSKGNRYAGRTYDADHAVSGRIVVTVNGNRQTMRVTSARGSARLTLRRR